MYQVHVWNRTYWDDTQLTQIYTTETEAVAQAVERGDDPTDMGLYGIIEDGQDVPYTIVYSGREFPRKPVDD